MFTRCLPTVDFVSDYDKQDYLSGLCRIHKHKPSHEVPIRLPKRVRKNTYPTFFTEKFITYLKQYYGEYRLCYTISRILSYLVTYDYDFWKLEYFHEKTLKLQPKAAETSVNVW